MLILTLEASKSYGLLTDGRTDRQTDRQTDICISRAAFAAEKVVNKKRFKSIIVGF